MLLTDGSIGTGRIARVAAGIAAALIAVGAHAQAPPPVDEPAPSAIRLDQLGFEADGPKRAVVVSQARTPLAWTVTDAKGAVVAHGQAKPWGEDASSGQRLQGVDLSALHTPGRGYVLHVGGQASRPFSLSDHPFRQLKLDALHYFYETRSGIAIARRFVSDPARARPAGHLPDIAACFSGRDAQGQVWPGCTTKLDATGGWYDAGDQGKYVVNGGVAVWTLLNAYERTHGGVGGPPDRSFDDGRLAIPEAGNGVSDLLDEARWELRFMLAMQAPQGARLRLPGADTTGGGHPDFTEIDGSGLVHHKLADAEWTPLPTPPQSDREPRLVYPVSTAATLNLAAVAAQAARIWRTIDPAFSSRCLQAAERAFAAARRHPDILAVGGVEGSGGYGDRTLGDEAYWAAAELFVTTGQATYLEVLRASPFFLKAPGAGMSDISWAQTAGMGAVDLATLPNRLPADALRRQRAALLAGADAYLTEGRSEGYGLPYAAARGLPWGSNGSVLNHALVLGVAYDLSGRRRYRDGVVDALDYVLGRNALDRAYVTGYGARSMHNPHHRFWARQFDPKAPTPPPGVLSGGPNSEAMTDPVSRPLKGTCPPQACWRDDARAFTFNEVAINWNAPLFWTAAFLDSTSPDPARGPKP